MPAQVSTIPADLPEPGVYYLVSVWSPRVLDSTKPDRNALSQRAERRLGRAYAATKSGLGAYRKHA
jgi:hypothetical protein